MIDFLKLYIPFKEEHIFTCKDGETSFLKEALSDIAKKVGLKLRAGSITFQVNGDLNVSELSHPYESIPSHFGSLAMKIFNGSDLTKTPPYVELKASPAKLLQGHNIFGTTNISICSYVMLGTFSKSLPELYDMMDLEKVMVDWIDVTYSAHISEVELQKQVIDFLQQIKSGHTKKTRYNKEYETTAEWNSGSSHRTLKVYLKGHEVYRRLNDARKELKNEPNKKYLKNVIDILGNIDLINFSQKCVRFEARLKQRYLQGREIPRNLFKLIEYQRHYEEKGKDLIEDLWKEAFKDIMQAIGQAKMDIFNKADIQNLLKKSYFKVTPKGNISYAKADRLFSFYRNILNDGYQETLNSMPRNTFWRNEKDLMAVGITRAQLQNLKGFEQKNNNIIPVAKLVEIDFTGQRPPWYREPTMQDVEMLLAA